MAQNLVLLATVVLRFDLEKAAFPHLSSQERALQVFKAVLIVEAIAASISVVISLVAGLLYELWTRKKVLALSFIVLAIGLVFPALRHMEEDTVLFTVSRVVTYVMAQVIL